MGNCRSHLIRFRNECPPLFPGATNYHPSAGDHSSNAETCSTVLEGSQCSLTQVSRVFCTAGAGLEPGCSPREVLPSCRQDVAAGDTNLSLPKSTWAACLSQDTLATCEVLYLGEQWSLLFLSRLPGYLLLIPSAEGVFLEYILSSSIMPSHIAWPTWLEDLPSNSSPALQETSW